MRTIGIIDINRLTLIPTKYWKAHEFCFFIHDSLVQLLIEYEASDVHNVVVQAFENAIKGREEEFKDVDESVKEFV